ncbi:MAG TPA: ABC transporter substrate binding protein [Bradyrhizobium sp.]|uniref:ABC transporter substrate binding protein n=1 Tax=Bradyrhizobium sp. TaxID=376 RepID=UPI002C91D79D|nr:ABC transporter substrate binding protein [Bradyrhizobium sp.]HXB77910.1 ABC transporter substrate binding protein [Bradyrhizobium sp.]
MIVALATSGVQAVRNTTISIPIVMAARGDPVGPGFVASLARPGGNITVYKFSRRFLRVPTLSRHFTALQNLVAFGAQRTWSCLLLARIGRE